MALRSKPTKHEQATAKAAVATDLFTTAHDNLEEAVALLNEAEAEHRAQALTHESAAEQAKLDAERNERVRARLAELLA